MGLGITIVKLFVALVVGGIFIILIPYLSSVISNKKRVRQWLAVNDSTPVQFWNFVRIELGSVDKKNIDYIRKIHLLTTTLGKSRQFILNNTTDKAPKDCSPDCLFVIVMFNCGSRTESLQLISKSDFERISNDIREVTLEKLKEEIGSVVELWNDVIDAQKRALETLKEIQ